MGSNSSQQSNKEKTFVNKDTIKPIVSYTINNSDSNSYSESELSKESIEQKQRYNKLQNPSTQRPVELSWLQQNNSNSNYNQINHRHHYHHRHHHSQHQHLHQRPLAINRWPKDNDQIEEEKPKSFIQEYIRQ